MREILQRFPSLAYVAREIGVGYKAVTKWYERASVPAKYDLALVELAERDGIPLRLGEIAKIRAAEGGGSSVSAAAPPDCPTDDREPTQSQGIAQ